MRQPFITARVIGLLVVLVTTAGAQPLDVAALSPEAATVYGIWQRYLVSKEGKYSSKARVPSADWTESEQEQWPVYDLASFYLLDDAVPEVIGIDPVETPGGREYRIRTRFRHGDQKATAPSWWTAMTMTVYAVRNGDRWRLANALPRHTREWSRDIVGPITYVYPPRYPYDTARARRAVAFADSVASVFGLPRLVPITYYLARSVDEVFAIMGLESDVKFGPVGGAAQPVNRQLFSGIPAIGEEYRHELAHLVLAPLSGAKTLYFVSEGVATWLGGTTGVDYPSAVRGLAAFLAQRPAVSLDSLLWGSFPAAQLYPAAAVLVAMVFDEGGVAAVRELFNAGPTPAALRATVQRQLARPWSTIAEDWHRLVTSFVQRYERPSATSPASFSFVKYRRAWIADRRSGESAFDSSMATHTMFRSATTIKWAGET